MSGEHAKREMVTGEKPEGSGRKNEEWTPSKETDKKHKEESAFSIKSHRKGDKNKKKMKKVVYYETDYSSPSTSGTESTTSKHQERKKYSKMPLCYPHIPKCAPILSVPLGKPPYFYGEDYCMWSDKMRHHLTSLHESIWDIIGFGARAPQVGDEDYDSNEATQIRHFNSQAKLDTCLIAKTNMGWLWHRQLAHVGMKNLHKLLKREHILGLTNVHFKKDRVCSACQAGKQVGVHHPHKNIMTTDRPLELLHLDLFGPIAYISIGGSKYYLVIVDDYSRFTWVFFLQEKSQTQETLKRFLRHAQNEFGLRIKKIRSDNGTEFKNSQIEGFLEEEGIKHEFSSPYTPQQNGIVERKNRTLLDMARTMLDEYKTPDRFWAEAINTACYSINRLYLHRILKKTSYELLTGKKPNVSYFRVFGSKCFILIKRGRSSKFAPKAVEGFLLGYDSNTRTYRVFNKSTALVEVSCDIVFDETNGSHVEQVDLDELVDEGAPCVTLRNMSIEDVCPKESEEPTQAQDQHHLPTKHLHQLKMRIWLKMMKMKIKRMSHLKRRTLIEGEMKIMKIRKMIEKLRIKDRHTQESTKQFKEITLSTPFLVTFIMG
jgi:transposase InsO family protein